MTNGKPSTAAKTEKNLKVRVRVLRSNLNLIAAESQVLSMIHPVPAARAVCGSAAATREALHNPGVPCGVLPARDDVLDEGLVYASRGLFCPSNQAGPIFSFETLLPGWSVFALLSAIFNQPESRPVGKGASSPWTARSGEQHRNTLDSGLHSGAPVCK